MEENKLNMGTASGGDTETIESVEGDKGNPIDPDDTHTVMHAVATSVVAIKNKLDDGVQNNKSAVFNGKG
jgi:hypothetical protein